jgi:ATP-binding cassette, subfamily B, bacterial
VATSTTNQTPDTGSLTKLLMPYIRRHRVLVAMGIFGAVVGALASFSIGLALRHVIDTVPTNANEGYQYLNHILGLALAALAAVTAVGFVSSYSLMKVTARVVRDLRHDVFCSLIGQQVSYLEHHPSGELQTRIIADTGTLGGFSTRQVAKVVTAGMGAIAGIVGALYISAWLTMVVIAFLPLVFLPLLVWGRRLRELSAETQQRTAELGKATGEVLRNIKVVHVHNQESHESSRFLQLADAVATTMVRSNRLRLAMETLVSVMATSAALLLVWSAAKGIYSGVLTVGELISFAFFNSLIVQSVSVFFGLAAALKQTLGAAQRIMDYMSVEAHPWPSRAKSVSIQGAIEFRGIHFKYPARPQINVLRDVSFVIEAGATVTIVGPTGAGKSALFELLLGLYSPDAGTILIDGTDCRELGRDQLRSSIGYVPQRESLRSGTVFDNIVYGAATTNEARVVEAAKVACAHEFIVQLPHGYQTDLGEVAARLSGGQKQRISLARALVREPRILLLDEEKSALDADSERRVSSSVRNWAASRGATVVSIAHRLSNLDSADRILVVNEGAVVGYGHHAELLAGCDTYRTLVSSYFGAEGSVTREERVPALEISAT